MTRALPSDEEIAAIAVALSALEPAREIAVVENGGVSRWALAGRLPELDLDDVRAGRVVL